MKRKRSLISLGALIALTGFLLSGPVGFLLTQVTKPQPAWTGAADFVANYHPVQNIPYFFGFILVGGMLLLVSAHYTHTSNASEADQLHIFLSVIWTAIFATLIVFNYICQTTFVHHIATNYRAGDERVLEIFTMANPASLGWSVEMWGYALLGVATWLLSAFYREKNKLIYVLLITNGVASVLGAVLFMVDNRWLLTTAGLISYFAWNFLMIVILFLIYRLHRKAETLKQ